MIMFQWPLNSNSNLRTYGKRKRFLGRWTEYISELFENHRKEYNVMKRNFAGQPIMKDEIRAALRKMNSGKAADPDSISVELL